MRMIRKNDLFLCILRENPYCLPATGSSAILPAVVGVPL